MVKDSSNIKFPKRQVIKKLMTGSNTPKLKEGIFNQTKHKLLQAEVDSNLES